MEYLRDCVICKQAFRAERWNGVACSHKCKREVVNLGRRTGRKGGAVMRLPTDRRECFACRTVKSIESFHRDRTGTLGRSYQCKACKNAAVKRPDVAARRLARSRERSATDPSYRAIKAAQSRKSYQNNPPAPEVVLFRSAKYRARTKGLTFDLAISDVTIPKICPLLGLTLRHNKRRGPRRDSATLDRIDPKMGYVRGNIWVISERANRIKNDATVEELESLAANLRHHLRLRFP